MPIFEPVRQLCAVQGERTCAAPVSASPSTVTRAGKSGGWRTKRHISRRVSAREDVPSPTMTLVHRTFMLESWWQSPAKRYGRTSSLSCLEQRRQKEEEGLLSCRLSYTSGRLLRLLETKWCVCEPTLPQLRETCIVL